MWLPPLFSYHTDTTETMTAEQQSPDTDATPKQGRYEGAKLVASAILGLDYRVLIINSKAYTLYPPTIGKLAAAAYWLADMGEGSSLNEILRCLSKSDNLAHAMSHLIEGNDDLYEELKDAKMDELVSGIETAFSMIDVSNFIKLSALQRSASLLIAKPK